MVISSFISSILVLALGVWAYMRLETTMNSFSERQLQIEPSKFSYKMWKDMPVTMYQSFTFFNLTNWNQVKSVGQKPRFVEVGPYVYKTIWTKQDVNFLDEQRLISFSERKQWIFDPKLSKGLEEDLIWTINTPLMTALALIQNAPVITRNVVSVILDGLGEGAFIKRSIKSLLFDGYSDLIVSVGPLFDRRFANFNGKFAYLYNKNDSVDGTWTVSTGIDDIANLNKITRFQSSIVNLTSFSSGQLPQGLNEVKPECAAAWSLDQSTNGQLFAPFNSDLEQVRLQHQLQAVKARASPRSSPELGPATPPASSSPVIAQAKRFFSRSAAAVAQSATSTSTTTSTAQTPVAVGGDGTDPQELVPNPFLNQKSIDSLTNSQQANQAPQTSNSASQDTKPQLRDVGKFIFYPDLCRPLHLLPSRQEVTTANGIRASRYYIDPRIFMNSTQMATNRCFEMNPKPALANALAATINSVTGANVAIPNLVTGASSPFAMFSPPSGLAHHFSHHNHHANGESGGPFSGVGIFERSNHPTSFLNNALHSLGATVGATANGLGGGAAGLANSQLGADQQTSASSNAPIMGRLSRVRQLFSNIVSQRMSGAGPGSLLPSLASGPAGVLIGNHNHNNHLAPMARTDDNQANAATLGSTLFAHNPLTRRAGPLSSAMHAGADFRRAHHGDHSASAASAPIQQLAHQQSPALGASDRWVTQFRFKWPRGVFSIGQCQLGAPIYASLPHFLDADEYYLEQVDGLKPNRSLHEFYIDIESTLHSIPVGAKARLQLNVATPELRFRNIPNAMIPVLWQEVTFNIDRPVASMLYWSFTMSSTIYQVISVLVLLLGAGLMLHSLVGGFSLQRLRRAKSGRVMSSSETESQTSALSSSHRSHRGSTSGASSSHSSISSGIDTPHSPNIRSSSDHLRAQQQHQLHSHTNHLQQLSYHLQRPHPHQDREGHHWRRSSWHSQANEMDLQ